MCVVYGKCTTHKTNMAASKICGKICENPLQNTFSQPKTKNQRKISVVPPGRREQRAKSLSGVSSAAFWHGQEIARDLNGGQRGLVS